jgi:hypothetical protein
MVSPSTSIGIAIEWSEYIDTILQRIMDYDKWPSISYPENLEMINEIADWNLAIMQFSTTF